MNQEVTRLYDQMTAQLQEIALSSENILQHASQSCVAVEETLRKLKAIIVNYEFRDTKEEINFFKTMKPMFLRELIYFNEVFQIEAWKPPVGIQEEIAHYMLGAKKIDLYFKINNSMFTYYRTQSTAYDEQYFLRGKQPEYFNAPLSTTDLDPRFSTPYSIQFAQMEAYEQFSKYISEAIHHLENPTEAASSVTGRPKLVWTDSKTALIELGYALFAHKSVNFGKAKLGDIMTAFEWTFNIQLGNYHRTFQNMRIRKDRAPFLKEAGQDLSRLMESADSAD